MTRSEEIEKGIEYFRANRNRMSSLYKELFGEDICLTCPNVKDATKYAYNKMYENRNKVIGSIRMECGHVIWDEETQTHYTCKNITDEVAKKLIEKGYADYFIL